MGQVLCEPFELTEFELDAVAGGNPFSYSTNSGSFAIGAVLGDFSTASGIFAGRLNIFEIGVNPSISIANIGNTSLTI